MSNMLKAFEVQKYVRTCARKGNMGVAFEDIAAPRTDGNTIYLPHVTWATSEDRMIQYMHFAAHESKHNTSSDFDILKEKCLAADNSFLGLIWNLIEDHRIDFLNGQEYEGDRQRCDIHRSIVNEEIVESVYPTAKADPQNQQLNQVLPLLQWEGDAASEWLASTGLFADEIGKFLGTKGKEYAKKFAAGNYRKELERIRLIEDPKAGTAATYELSKRIYEEVYGQDAKKEEERAKAQAQQGGKGKGQKKKGDKDGPEGDAAEGGGEGGEEFSDKEVDDPDYRIVERDWTDFASSGHTHNPLEHQRRTGIHLKSDDSGKDGVYINPPEHEYMVKDYGKGENHRGIQATSRGYTRETLPSMQRILANHSCEGFANRIRTKLQVRARAKTQYGVKRGKLHKASVYRVVVPDAPGFNQKVFKRRIETDTLDTCVQVVCDISGSMGGQKLQNAIVSSVLLGEVLGNVLHIPVEVVGFTHFHNPDVHDHRTAMFVYRDFNTKMLGKDELMERMCDSSANMANNADGEAVLWSYNRIKQRKEKRKLMIVLSDGSPAGTSISGSISDHTKKVVQAIEKSGQVEIVGIGIMDQNVKRFYKEHQVINDSNELEQALLQLIDKKLV